MVRQSLKNVKVVKNRAEVIETLCKHIKQASDESVKQRGVFTIGLSGASLVTFLAEGLPTIATDFTKWKLFFCDERIVPEDSDDSTFGQYKVKLLAPGKVNLKEEQFVRIKQGLSAKETAIDYANQLAHHFPGQEIPEFDLLLLGMGPDGHTCSLFPGHPLLEEKDSTVAYITDSPKPPPNRITLTYRVINKARRGIFALTGQEKSEVINKIFVGGEDFPAGRVGCGDLVWIMDEGAGDLIRARL